MQVQPSSALAGNCGARQTTSPSKRRSNRHLGRVANLKNTARLFGIRSKRRSSSNWVKKTRRSGQMMPSTPTTRQRRPGKAVKKWAPLRRKRTSKPISSVFTIPDEFHQRVWRSPKSSGTAIGKHRTSPQNARFGVCGRPRAKVGGED